ncbi:hypothetical protein D3C76_1718020 [compost metagenome]
MRFQLIKRGESLLIAYFFTQDYIYMATVKVHYNVQQMHFELLAYASHCWTGTNIGHAGQRLIAQPHHFYRKDPFYRGNLTAQR